MLHGQYTGYRRVDGYYNKKSLKYQAYFPTFHTIYLFFRFISYAEENYIIKKEILYFLFFMLSKSVFFYYHRYTKKNSPSVWPSGFQLRLGENTIFQSLIKIEVWFFSVHIPLIFEHLSYEYFVCRSVGQASKGI